jgi:hypothetical protein
MEREMERASERERDRERDGESARSREREKQRERRFGCLVWMLSWIWILGNELLILIEASPARGQLRLHSRFQGHLP